jgi:hypothetical protein
VWVAWIGAAALAGTASLHVGVHREAGTVYNIAADGADGMCTVQPARISCPASGTVTFRWGPGGDWELTGQTQVAPGEIGRAFVLAPDAKRQQELEQLTADGVTPERIRELFLVTSAAPAPPSRAMIAQLGNLADHPDAQVQRAVIDALVPWWRHTAADPLPQEAPPILPGGLIRRLSRDENVRTRRRMANRLREVRQGHHQEEALNALLELTEDRGPVQRAAMASLSLRARAGTVPAEIAWQRAMLQVQEPGPPGRAAANTIGHLGRAVGAPTSIIDPVEGLRRVLQHHTERGWSVWLSWREHVPFERAWVDLLLRNTVGLSEGLVVHWAEAHPEQFAEALRAWEPGPPHSDRFEQVIGYLSDSPNPAVRGSLGLDPFPAPSAPPPESE